MKRSVGKSLVAVAIAIGTLGAKGQTAAWSGRPGENNELRRESASVVARAASAERLRVLSANAGTSTATGGHLYVTAGGPVDGFLIVNGILSSKPDRVYDHVPGFLAVSLIGEFYSVSGSGSQSAQLSTYAVQDGRLLRSLTVLPPKGERPAAFAIVSVGLDAQRYIYVGVESRTPGSPNHYSVEVYEPRAQGSSPPVSVFLTGERTEVGAFTFDKIGEAFLALPQRDAIVVVTNPRSAPKVVRELKGAPRASV